MTFADWSAEESHHHPVSLPTIVSTTDLFDGELFGDELIDIYNSTVADGTHDIILPEAKDDKEVDEDHPGTKMAVAAAAIDDGLGAFRPSTSFNDLTTLLPPEGAEAKPAADPEKPAAKSTKKRGIQHNVEVPAAKRKAAAPRGNRRPSTKKVTAATAVVKTEPTPEPEMSVAPTPTVIICSEPKTEDDTPNPLVPEAAVSSGMANGEQVGSGDGDEPSKTPTEADFKSIAQAAVSNLIMSVSTTAKSVEEASTTPTDNSPVDTSTAHIKALTGNNWVAACSSNASTVSAENSASDAKGNNRVRRQNLTADERAQQNRDRNREHARNTRLRKKAYVEELKRTLTELVAQRDAAEAEKRQVAQRELEQREVRFRVTEEFLKLKGRNEPNAARWSAILEDGFALTVPRMEFYKQADGEKTNSEITFKGVAKAMEDTKNFTAFLQTLSGGNNTTAMQFHCDRKNFFMDGCNAFLQWNATMPAAEQVSLTGVIRCVFSPASNKLISANFTFDSGSLLSQIRSKSNPEHGHEDSAAQAAANEADAILDSLQMPRLNTIVPSNVVAVVPPSSESTASEGSLDKGDSCDESLGDHPSEKHEDVSSEGMTTRRIRRSE